MSAANKGRRHVLPALADRYQALLDEHRAGGSTRSGAMQGEPAGRPKSATSPESDGRPARRIIPAITLRGQGKPVLVRGNKFPPLTPAEYVIVRRLRRAGPKGLTGDQIEAKTGRGGYRHTLRMLRDRRPIFRDVIRPPGGRGGRWRMVFDDV
jgi:hypothetical protein